MIGPADEAPRAPTGPAFADTVAVAFADPAAAVFGSARVDTGAQGTAALAILFAGGALAAAETGAAVTIETVEPLAAWHARFESPGAGFDLDLRAAAPPAEAAAGLEGYAQLCAVAGTVTVAGEERAVDGIGERLHHWGETDTARLEAQRLVSVWLGGGRGVVLAAARPAGADGHDAELVRAAILEPPEGNARPHVVPVGDPRLSTTLDRSGRQYRAGLELWVDEGDDYPHRASGEAVCATSLDLGPLRLDAAFFRWRMEGLEGIGRYDVVRAR